MASGQVDINSRPKLSKVRNNLPKDTLYFHGEPGIWNLLVLPIQWIYQECNINSCWRNTAHIKSTYFIVYIIQAIRSDKND